MIGLLEVRALFNWTIDCPLIYMSDVSYCILFHALKDCLVAHFGAFQTPQLEMLPIIYTAASSNFCDFIKSSLFAVS